jgi:uncharacterized protein YdeI (YjbR/CyaY-like superfamily)
MIMSSKSEPDEVEVIAFRDAAEFEAWLAEHVDQSAGVWLKIAKKGSGVASLTDDEAVDVGLCYGWISGQRKALDEVYYLQKYVPRRPRSHWSQVNVRKVEELTVAGRMRPLGLAEVEAATAAGTLHTRLRRRPARANRVIHPSILLRPDAPRPPHRAICPGAVRARPGGVAALAP